MKVSSLKYLLILLGFIASATMATSCNKGYGCPADFHADASIEVQTPSC